MDCSSRIHLLHLLSMCACLGVAANAQGGIIVTPFRVAALPSGWDQIDFRVTAFTGADTANLPSFNGITSIEGRILPLDGAVLSFPGIGAAARNNTRNTSDVPVDPFNPAPKSFVNFENVLGQTFVRTPDNPIASDVFGTWFTVGDNSQPPVPTFLRPVNVVDDEFDETLFARVFVSHGGGVQISGLYSSRIVIGQAFATTLASVPEPGTAILLIAGSAGLLFCKRFGGRAIQPQNRARCII